MKTRILCFLVFVSIFALHSVASAADVKQSVEALLKKNNIQVSSVEYSPSDKVLTLKNCIGISADAPSNVFKVDEIVFTDFNESALTAQPGDTLRLAASIEYKNIQAAVDINEMKANVVMGGMRAVNMDYNLNSLFNSSLAPNKLLAGMDKLTADSFEYSNIKISVDGVSPTTVTIKSMNFVGFGKEKINSFKMDDLVIQNQIPAENKEHIVQIGSMEALDVGLISQDYLTFLMEKHLQIIAGTLSAEDIAKYNALSDAYNKSDNELKVTLQNMSADSITSNVKMPLFSLKELSIKSLFDVQSLAQFDFLLGIKGLEVDYKMLGADEFFMLSMFKTNKPVLDFTLETTFKTNDKESVVTLTAADPKGVAVKVQGKMLFPKANLLELSSYPVDKVKLMQFFKGTQFSALSLETKDVAVQMPGSDKILGQLKSFTSDLKYDYKSETTAQLNLNVADLLFATSLLGFSESEMPIVKTLLNTDMPKVNSSLNVDFNTDNSPSSLEYSVTVDGVASLKSKFDLMLPQKKISELVSWPLNNIALKQFMAASSLSNVRVEYTDQGLAPRGLKVFSTKKQQSEADVADFLGIMARQLTKNYQQMLTSPSVDNLVTCIKNPGTLTVNAKAKETLLLSPEFMGQLQKPGVLEVDIQCTAGKDIVTEAKKVAFSMPAATQAPQQSAAADATQSVKKAPEKAVEKPVEKAPEETAKKAPEKAAEKAPTDGDLVAPLPKKPGVAEVVSTMHDTMGPTSFGVDGKADTIVRTLAYGNSPIVGVLVQNMGGKAGSWKSKDAKGQAPGVLAVEVDGIVQNVGDASFSLDVKSPTIVDLIMQDNGALVDTKTRMRVVFFHKDGTYTYAIIKR